MASHGQIANDMAAWASFFAKRDKKIAATCRDAARVIRAYLAGESVDGRTVTGVITRLDTLGMSHQTHRHFGLPQSAERAAGCLRELRRASSRP